MPRPTDPNNQRRFTDSDGKLVDLLDRDQTEDRLRRISGEDSENMVELRRANLAARKSRGRDRALVTQALDAAMEAGRRGTSSRQVAVRLPVLNPGGLVDVGLWIPARKVVIIGIAVAYLTTPTSVGGTVVLDVSKVSGAITTLVQAAAGFDLEALAAGVSVEVPLVAKADRSLLAGDYLYATLTSNNGDAVDGTGGIIVVTYNS